VIIAEDTFTLTATGSVGGTAVATGTTQANVNPGVEVLAPEDQAGLPSEVMSYDFQVTNTGDYTDSFALEVSGVWTATLPGGDNTGLLAAGESITVTVLVQIPDNMGNGYTDGTTLTATSGLDPAVNASADVTTTANVNPGVEVVPPEDQTGFPLDVMSYDFQVTNTGDYTDSFALDVSWVWTATLPGGDNTGLLAPEASTTVTVLVQVPEDVGNGDTDVTTLTITSDLDPDVTASGDVITTAQLMYYNLLPLIRR
jgi:uncharacterized membrane protein